MLLLAAAVLGGGEGMPPGSEGLVACGEAVREATAGRFGSASGVTIATIFLIGVWGAVFTSTLGVWNGVPYLFADYLDALRGKFDTVVDTAGIAYRGYLFYLAVPPMVLLFLDRPMWVIKVYTLTGGLFMPLLAVTLLWLNSRRRLVGELKSGLVATVSSSTSSDRLSPRFSRSRFSSSKVTPRRCAVPTASDVLATPGMKRKVAP
jgi:hypothetical protein